MKAKSLKAIPIELWRHQQSIVEAITKRTARGTRKQEEHHIYSLMRRWSSVPGIARYHMRTLLLMGAL